MVRNLLKAGHELIVYDVVRSNVDEVVKGGAKAASSSKDAAAQCSLIITMLPNSPMLRVWSWERTEFWKGCPGYYSG